MALIECSFCRNATEAFDMVWSRHGKAICGRCVALFSADVKEIGLAGKLAIQFQSCDIEVVRREIEDGRGTAGPQAEATHLIQRMEGERAVAYMHPNDQDWRVLLKGVVPWLPERRPV